LATHQTGRNSGVIHSGNLLQARLSQGKNLPRWQAPIGGFLRMSTASKRETMRKGDRRAQRIRTAKPRSNPRTWVSERRRLRSHRSGSPPRVGATMSPESRRCTFRRPESSITAGSARSSHSCLPQGAMRSGSETAVIGAREEADRFVERQPKAT